MEKDTQSRDVDVSDEAYKGPSAHVAALGNGVVKHYKWAVIGTVGGLGFAMLRPKEAKWFIDNARNIATKWKNAEVDEGAHFFAKKWRDLKRGSGALTHLIVGDEAMAGVLGKASENIDCLGTFDPKTKAKAQEWFQEVSTTRKQGFGHWFASHTFGILPFFGKFFKKEILTPCTSTDFGANALTFGGVLGFTGYVAGWLKALISGAQHGNQGKYQFERAKSQIQNLQEDNQDLNKINDELHAKYVKAATRLDTIQAAQDAARSELPAAASEASPMLQAAAPTTEVQLDQKQHQGKLAQAELAVA